MHPKVIYLPCALGSRFLGPVGSILASWNLLGWFLAFWGLMGWILTSCYILSWSLISWEPPALNFGFQVCIRASWAGFLPGLDSRLWGLLR